MYQRPVLIDRAIESPTTIALLIFLLWLLVFPARTERQLKAKNGALRQQLAILQRKQRGRVQPTNGDRLFFVHLYRWFPSILATMTIIQPQTLVRWHREVCMANS